MKKPPPDFTLPVSTHSCLPFPRRSHDYLLTYYFQILQRNSRKGKHSCEKGPVPLERACPFLHFLPHTAYMEGVLAHPRFVGAHWFRYKDQSLTGRHSDGANAQNGLLDICDTP